MCYFLPLLFLMILYIISYCVDAVHSDDGLRYWDPNSEVDSRKLFDKEHMSKPNHTNQKPFLRSKKHHVNAIEKHGKAGRDWPKVHQHPKQIRRNKSIMRSTRMTPYKLMQNTGEDKKTTKRGFYQESESSIVYLDPYSIEREMKKLTNCCPGVNITLEVIGRTVEYNNIILLKITEAPTESARHFRAEDKYVNDETPEKKIVFIVHGLSVMGIRSLNCLFDLEDFKTLLSMYTHHLDKFDIFLVPMANPDGISADMIGGTERTIYWNKNKSPQLTCPGVALDRNFDVAWNASNIVSSCSQNYPGPMPFSELETQAIKKVFHRYSHKMAAYLNVHAGTHSASVFKGDAVLYPKGYTDVLSDDDKYVDLRGEIDEALRNASFTVMSVTVDTLYNWYGKVSGTSVDYASSVYGIPYAMELVMQLYTDPMNELVDESISHLVLTEVWERVIDVIFDHIDRNIYPSSDES